MTLPEPWGSNREHIDDTQVELRKILWSDETKFELFANNDHHYVWRKFGEALLEKNIVPTANHRGGSIMLWGCFATAGTGSICVVEFRGTSPNFRWKREPIGVERYSFDKRFLLQQDNDPKHTSKSTTKYFASRRMKVMKCPFQSPDLNPIEHPWKELKSRVRKRRPSNIAELKAFAVEEWSNILTETCKNLVRTYKKRMVAVIAAKKGHTKY